MKKSLLLFGLLAPLGIFAQARLVINGAAPVTIVENGGTAGTPIYIELANGNANAITTVGTNGWIISENEFNMVKWDISNNIGTYIIPFGVTAATYYLPLKMELSAGGNAGGSMKFSTYHTAADNNLLRPSDVTNMAPVYTALSSPTATNNSYNAVDRFWILDANSYTTKPTPSAGNGITFSYMRGATSEVAAPNVFLESNLFAQRFNIAAGKGWGDWAGISGSDLGVGNVGTAYTGAVTSANMFRSWTLSNSLSPLPVTLTSFTGTCDNGEALIQWTTASEINNDFFTIEKSTDGVHWTTVVTNKPGAGNSSTTINYSYIDNTPYPGVSYYELFQTDYDGNQTHVGTFEFDGCGGVTNSTQVAVYNSGTYIDVQINSPESGNFNISLIDMLGQTLSVENKAVVLGNNEFRLYNTLSPGIYFVNVRNSEVNFTKKLVVGVK